MRRTIFGLKPAALFDFYRWRLRSHGVHELLAACGIAIGVAIVFAVQVANTSISGSVEQVLNGIRGAATLEMTARSGDGFDERIGARAARLPGVLHAAPLLRRRVAIVGPRGRRTVELEGITPELAKFGGSLVRNFGPGGLRLPRGITLPAGVARSVGAAPGQRVTLLVEGRARRVAVGPALGRETVGPIADSPVALASLRFAQAVTGSRARITQVVVQPQPGRAGAVERGLERLADGRLTVAHTDAELRLLRRAAEPNDQSTGLFSAIGAMVGLLFAFSAVLLTVPERRRFIADLRVQGFDRRQILAVLGFEALALGCAASLAGLALGDVLSRTLFDEVPGYLAVAFPIGAQRVVEASTVALAVGGGMLAALIASALPTFDLFSRRPLDVVFRDIAEAGEGIAGRTLRLLLVVGIALAGATTLLVASAPQTTVVGGIALAVATLLALPAVFSFAMRPAARLSRRVRGSMLPLAVMELRATTTRSVALAAVAALAVFGSVAIQGARRDLLRGLDRNFAEYASTADIWVTSAPDLVGTESFRPTRRTAALERARGVAAVHPYQGAFVDSGDRRLWLIARPRDERAPIPASEVVEGNLADATRKVSRRGWATVSNTFADSRNLDPGDAFAVPTPRGTMRFKVAAITTNLSWAPGAMIINTADFARGWGTRHLAGLEVDLDPGVTPLQGKRIVERALSGDPGLRVQTQSERTAQFRELAQQGLTRLSQIATVLLIGAGLALAFAMGGAIWQRRPRLAALKIQGFDHAQLWRGLLLETGFVLGVGCAAGALAGLYGHFLLTRWLKLTTGFPAPFAAWDPPALLALALLTVIALVAAALPGWAAARVPARAVFQE